MLDSRAIGLQNIEETSFAVVDIESTGLIPGADRIVELAIVRLDPGQEPRVVLETLIRPMRPMAATEIHGICDQDVADAPRFEDIVGDFMDAVEGCCLAAYNASFDMGMLRRELEQVGVRLELPHICLMGLRPDLGLGGVVSLDRACRSSGVRFYGGHMASFDAQAEAQLLVKLLQTFKDKKISRLGDLLHHSKKAFCESLVHPALPGAAKMGLRTGCHQISRPWVEKEIPDERRILGLYADALQAAIADGEVSDEEIAGLKELQHRFGLKQEQVRSLHARLFGMFLSLYADDEWMAEAEVKSLQTLRKCLRQLGWAPGD